MSAQLREEVLRKKNELMKEQKQIDKLTKENESNLTQVQENEKRAKAAETKLSEIKAETKMVSLLHRNKAKLRNLKVRFTPL